MQLRFYYKLCLKFASSGIADFCYNNYIFVKQFESLQIPSESNDSDSYHTP